LEYYLVLVVFSLLALALVATSIISVFEREYLAAQRSFLLSLIPIITINIYLFVPFSHKDTVYIVLCGFVFFAIVLLMIPLKGKQHKPNGDLQKRIDERTIMFSRKELIPGSDTFKKYYELHPHHKEMDDDFRKKPGLLDDQASYYDPLMFNSSKATFETVDGLANVIEGNVSNNKIEISKEELTYYISEWSKHLGAQSIGFTELNEKHIYSTAGRKRNYGAKIELNHRFAIAFTCEMDFNMVKSAPNAPIVMESAKQYLETGTIACQIAAFIRNLGFDARAHIDGNYQVICPLVAKDAGLGEIGRMGLLMTPKLGPRVRIGVVTTNAELLTDKRTEENSVIDFCTKCKKCAEVCPSNAISYNDREEIDETLRWQINQEACFNYWCVSGTDCGRCMSVCPYSHPNNFLHNSVRAGIKNSSLFRNFALRMDDLLYGRKPLPSQPLTWMTKHLKDSKQSY
jgi:ferredoxin